MSGRFVAALFTAGWAVLIPAWTSGQVTQHSGAIGDPTVAPSFQAATVAHSKEFIDFDNDGFILAAGQSTPIPSNHYAAQGVTVLNLDAVRPINPTWTHGPPIGAWHTGFSNPITTPYSFVFSQPVASFGMFANDVEATIQVTTVSSTTQQFTIPAQGGANVTRFHGFVAPSNAIQRIDFLSIDYHVIDDVQFGYIVIPEPGAGCAACLVIAAAARSTGRRNRGR